VLSWLDAGGLPRLQHVRRHIRAVNEDMQRNDFEIVSAMEPDLCSDDPSRKMMRQVLGAFSEYERTMIVIKLRGARQRMKAKTGHCEGRKPYGTHPGEDKIIKRMKELRHGGMAVDKVAATLNTEGLKPRGLKAKEGVAKTEGKEQWHATSVYRILKAAAAL